MASGQFGGDEGKKWTKLFFTCFLFRSLCYFRSLQLRFRHGIFVYSRLQPMLCVRSSRRGKQKFFSRNRIFLAARQFHVTERATGPCLDDAVRSISSSRSLGRLGLGQVPATAKERALSLQRAALIDRRHSGLSPHEH